MRSRTWIGAAAIAGLTTVSAVSLAVAQERQPGHEGPAAHQMEKGGGQAAGAGMQKGERAQSAQAQSSGEERLRNERSGQEKMGQGKMGQEKMGQEKMGQGMKPGEEGKAAQGAQRAGEEHNQAQNEKTKGQERAGQENQKNEHGAMNNQENGAANQPGEKGKSAERAGQNEQQNRGAETGREKGNTAAEGQTNGHRAGEAQTGRNETQNNRQGEQNARGENHVSPQKVHVEGNAHISNDQAARVADTLLSSNSEHVNLNVNDIRVGAALPSDVNLMPLPGTIVDMVPEYRGYDYVVANDEIVIVQPSTRHVVEVINTGGGEAMNEGAQAMASTHVAPCGNP